MELEIRMKLESPVLLASDEDRGAVLDADLVFDSNGVPYVPGRRLKGLLRERALEVVEMLNQCQLSLCDHADLVAVFGQGGAETPAPLFQQPLPDGLPALGPVDCMGAAGVPTSCQR